MPSSKIVYQNWIADLGRDPSRPLDLDDQSCQRILGSEGTIPGHEALPAEAHERQERIRETVRAALARLTDDERELIEQIHFMGRTCSEISLRSGRAEHRLESMHRRAMSKLRRHLAPLVRELFGILSPGRTDCPVCRSPYRGQIDQLISSRDPKGTWRQVIEELRKKFGLKITTPQTLIGHEKYH